MDTDDLDFFLLDIVSDHDRSLSVFTWDKSRRSFNAISGANPSFTREEVIAALLELQAAGDVRFLWGRGRPVRAVNAEDLEAGILMGVPLSYELTPQGGERWARLCAVDWGRWLDDRPDSANDDTSTTGDPEWTAFWFEVTQRWKKVVPESVRWDEVRPWRPVYWYEEAVGYRVSYRLAGDGEDRAHMPAEPWRLTPSPAAPLAPRRVRELPAAAPTGRNRARKGPRQEFAAVMEQARQRQDVVKLRHWLDWGNPPRRYAAARELGQRRDAGAVDALLESVFSEGDLASVEALAEIGDERCLAPLATLFAHLSEHRGCLGDTIGRTIASFGESGESALLPLVDLNGGAALQALRQTRSERAVEAVRARLGNSWQAISVLESMGVLSRWRRPKQRFSPEKLETLEAQAASPNWMSRYEVVLTLRDWFVDPTGAEPILARLRQDPDIVVRGFRSIDLNPRPMDTDDLDFFLLDIAVRCWLQLYCFSWNRSRLCLDFNREVPLFTRRELVAAFLELQAAGDIQFRHERRRLRSATADELEAGILGALPLLYSVTEHGGERWARLCGVDWRQWVECNDEEITSGDRELTVFWYEVAQRWADVTAESVKWEEVRPWRPFDWHEEAVGYRVSFIRRKPAEHRRGWPCPSQPSPERAKLAVPLAARRVRELPVAIGRRRRGSSRHWRVQFATALEEARGGADAKELREWLSYANELLRYAAARELGGRRDAESVRALLGAVFSFGDVAAVEALGQIGDAQCLAPLLTFFDYNCGWPQQMLDMLGRTIAGFREAGVTALLPFANTPRGSLALSHARSSQRAVDAVRAPIVPVRRASVADVEPLACREDWQSRLQAVELLRWCVDPQAAAPLLARLREDPDVVVRYCARKA